MQFLYSNAASLKPIVTYLKQLGSPHTVTIEKPKRSKPQNRTFHDNIDILAQHSGYTPYQMKLIIKEGITNARILEMATKIVTAKGIEITEYKSSADLTTKEFGLLMDYVFQIGQALGVKMNVPDDGLIQYATDLFK